jgi:uncharacterized protein
MRIEVAYSPSAGVVDRSVLELPPGATLQQALQASGLAQRHAELRADDLCVGVWGRKQPLDTALRDQDRVEVYRPLTVDPKEARRQRYRRQAR